MRAVFTRRFLMLVAIAAALALPFSALWAQSADRPALKQMLSEARPQVTEVSLVDARSMLKSGVLFLDVRSDNEWAGGHLPGARHMDRGKLEFSVETAVPDKSTPIIVYCKSGDRGTLSAVTLKKMGYTNVKNMTGGFVAWQKAGYEVAK